MAPLPIGFAVFMVHLATIPITGTGINPARSFGAAVIYNNEKAWDDQVSFSIQLLISTTNLASFVARKTDGLYGNGHAVDFLGGSFRRSSCSSCIPPVHPQSCSYQGFGILPQQPHQLKETKKRLIENQNRICLHFTPFLLLFFFFISPFVRLCV